MTRIDQLKDPRYLRHPRLKDRPLGVLTHPPRVCPKHKESADTPSNSIGKCLDDQKINRI